MTLETTQYAHTLQTHFSYILRAVLRASYYGVSIAAVSASTAASARAQCTATDAHDAIVPLTDLQETYQGYAGQLYPDGNVPPDDHHAAATARARELAASASRIGLVSIGVSNTNSEFGAFMLLSRNDPDVNPRVAMVNGAQGATPASEWADESDPSWDVLASRIKTSGLSAEDVRVVWIKHAEANPQPLGAFPRHAQVLQEHLQSMLAILKARYPNVDLALLSSRTRSCHTTGLNPEPYAYESGFAVKWLIESQLGGGALNPDSGSGEVVAPLLLWGPYLWAQQTPREDGFSWSCADTAEDCTHPSESGEEKVANLLLSFFKTNDATAPWFLNEFTPLDAGAMSIVDAGSSSDASVPSEFDASHDVSSDAFFEPEPAANSGASGCHAATAGACNERGLFWLFGFVAVMKISSRASQCRRTRSG